jgi:hypothetical protein
MVDNGMAGRLLRHAGARLADMGWMPRYPAAPAKVWASYQPALILTLVVASRRLAARRSRAGAPLSVLVPWIASSQVLLAMTAFNGRPRVSANADWYQLA